MYDRLALPRDLADADGIVFGKRGLVISVRGLKEMALAAPLAPRRALSETFLAGDLHIPLADLPFRYLFRGTQVLSAVARALLAVRLPDALFEELSALKTSDPVRYRHALATAAVASRMIIAAVGEPPALPEVAAAGLLHDLGMRHLSSSLLCATGRLDRQQTMDVAAHPLLGAFYLAGLLGWHPAVEATLTHHWQRGHGYPSLPRPPARAAQVVGVASAFTALTQARSYRSEPFDARGAADVLVGEAQAGRIDLATVRLLVHALRGAQGNPREVRLGRARPGHAPAVNQHTVIAGFPGCEVAFGLGQSGR